MYCNNCGTKLPDNAKFCNECGAKIGVIKVALEEDVKKEANINKGKKVKRLAVLETIFSVVFAFAITFLPIFECVDIDSYNSVRTLTIFEVVGVDSGLGVYCIITWLFIIPALFLFVRYSQMEKYILSFLCVAFITSMYILLFFKVAGYLVSMPKTRILPAETIEVASYSLVLIIIFSLSSLISFAYVKLKAFIQKEIKSSKRHDGTK